MLTGGCLCGKVRYKINGPIVAQAVCHCRNCQKQAATAFSVVAVVPRAAVEVEGALKIYHDKGDSGAAIERNFCPECGSPIYSDAPGTEVLYLKAGTLDDTSVLAPPVHVWCDSAWPWTPIPEGAIRFGKSPPG
jgi:hypothetical protein